MNKVRRVLQRWQVRPRYGQLRVLLGLRGFGVPAPVVPQKPARPHLQPSRPVRVERGQSHGRRREHCERRQQRRQLATSSLAYRHPGVVGEDYDDLPLRRRVRVVVAAVAS